MFIYELFVGKWQEHNKPTVSVDAPIAIGGLKQLSHHSVAASRFCFESAEEHGNRKACSTALMTT